MYADRKGEAGGLTYLVKMPIVQIEDVFVVYSYKLKVDIVPII